MFCRKANAWRGISYIMNLAADEGSWRFFAAARTHDVNQGPVVDQKKRSNHYGARGFLNEDHVMVYFCSHHDKNSAKKESFLYIFQDEFETTCFLIIFYKKLAFFFHI